MTYKEFHAKVAALAAKVKWAHIVIGIVLYVLTQSLWWCLLIATVVELGDWFLLAESPLTRRSIVKFITTEWIIDAGQYMVGAVIAIWLIKGGLP